MFKKKNVVMLPTNQKAPFGIGNKYIVLNNYIAIAERLRIGTVERVTDYGHEWSKEHRGIIQGLGVPQHLYITSDENPKLDEWGIYNGNVFKIEANKGISGEAKAIIASTDSTLNLPQPSTAFIVKFVEEYNKGNIITEVMVEYEPIGRMLSGGIETNIIEILKISSKDNTITIRRVKDSWSRPEVKQLCWQAYINHLCIDGKIAISTVEDTADDFEEWFKKNL